MKRYNKRQVMKDAHRLYNNDFQRRGRSWSECLRAAWSWERDAVKVFEEKAARLDAMIAASWKAHKPRQMRIGIKELIQKLFLMQWDMEEVTISIVVTN